MQNQNNFQLQLQSAGNQNQTPGFNQPPTTSLMGRDDLMMDSDPNRFNNNSLARSNTNFNMNDRDRSNTFMPSNQNQNYQQQNERRNTTMPGGGFNNQGDNNYNQGNQNQGGWNNQNNQSNQGFNNQNQGFDNNQGGFNNNQNNQNIGNQNNQQFQGNQNQGFNQGQNQSNLGGTGGFGNQNQNQFGQNQQQIGGNQGNFNNNQMNQPGPTSYDQNNLGKTTSGQMLDQKMKHLLEQIGKLMQQYQINDLTNFFGATFYNNTSAVQNINFVQQLQNNPLNLDLQSAQSIASAFKIQNVLDMRKRISNSYGNNMMNYNRFKEEYIDIKLLEANIGQIMFTGTSYQNFEMNFQQKSKGLELVNQLHLAIERYMVQNGSSIFQIFGKMADQTNHMQAGEMLNGMQALQMQSSPGSDPRQDAQTIINLMDTNKDGKVSYFEFCKHIAHQSDTIAINDTNHWAYGIFDQVRRHLQVTQMSLVQAFNIQNFQQQGTKLLMDSRSFVDALKSKMYVQIYDNQINDLLQLLDSNGQNGQIDLYEFQKLIGIKDFESLSQNQIKSNDRFKSNKKNKDQYLKLRSDMKIITQRLLSINVSESNMRMEFQYQLNQRFDFKQTVLHKNSFIQTLQKICQWQPVSNYAHKENIDQSTFQNIANENMTLNDQVDYEKFMQDFNQYKELINSITYLFQQIKGIARAKTNQGVQCFGIRDVLYQGGLPKQAQSIDNQTFTRIMNDNYIYIKENEQKILMIHYDLSGVGQVIDVNELEKDFNLMTADDFGSKQNACLDIWHQHSTSNPQPIGHAQPASQMNPQFQMAANKYKNELIEIVNECKQKNSNPNQWFKQNSKDGFSLQFQDWQQAINMLNVRSFYSQPQLIQSMFNDLMSKNNNQGNQVKIELNDLYSLFEKVGTMEIAAKFNPEQTIEKLIRAFNGDEIYLQQEAMKFDQYNQGRIHIQQMSGIMLGVDSMLKQSDIEDMLFKVAPQQGYNDQINIRAFTNEFSRIRDMKGFQNGKYNPQMSPLKIGNQPQWTAAGNQPNQPFQPQVTQPPKQADEKTFKSLQDIRKRVKDYCDSKKINLEQIFADYEKNQLRQNYTGFIDKRVFIQILESQNVQVFLNKLEQELIINEYISDTFNYKDQINYSKLIIDMQKKQSAISRVSMTSAQEKLIKELQSHVFKHKLGPKIAIALKKEDANLKGLLNKKVLDKALKKKDLKLNLGTNQTEMLFSCMKTNERAEYLIQELLELLCGSQEGIQLATSDVATLESGGVQNIKKNKGKFEVPAVTQGSDYRFLIQIGQKLINTRQNYEDQFLTITNGHGESYPLITEKQFNQALINFQIQITPQETQEINSYFKTNQNDDSKKAQLVHLQQALGLPPQTFGKDFISSQQASRLLKESEMEECKAIFVNLVKRGKELKNIDLNQMFDSLKYGANDDLNPPLFVQTLKKYIGEDWVKNNKIEFQIDIIVLYLQDKHIGFISHKKLLLALTRRNQDEALKQSNTENLRKVQADLTQQLTEYKDEEEIQNLAKHLLKNNMGIRNLIRGDAKGQTKIPSDVFKEGLKMVNFRPKDEAKFINSMTDSKGMVSLDKLKKLHEKFGKSSTNKDIMKDRLSNMPAAINKGIQAISDHLERNKITIQQFHKVLDENKDGGVTKSEWMNKMEQLQIPGVVLGDFGKIFDSLDVNGDGELSMAEFSLYIQGAEKFRENRRKNIEQDKDFMRDLDEQITFLYDQFDENNDGKIDAGEIMRGLQAVHIFKTERECKELLEQKAPGVGFLNKIQFRDLLLPLMIDEIMNQNDNIMKLREIFMDADVDGSGSISIGELYGALKKMGAELQEQELVQLVAEIDVDKNGTLDIDEFILLMTCGDKIQFEDKRNEVIFSSIQKARRMTPKDFIKLFKDMPQNFVPSFINDLWQVPQNLPSCVFKAQIDPRTMLWKDIRQFNTGVDWKILQEINKGVEQVANNIPQLRPIESTTACQINFIDAHGVPLPPDSSSELIEKRAINIAIEYVQIQSGAFQIEPKKEYIHNAIQIPAEWDASNQDIWTFNQDLLGSILFRTTKQDQLDKGKTRIIFELVIYVKHKGTQDVTVMSCGWCSIKLDELKRGFKHELPIQGGNPMAIQEIAQNDIRAQRTGMKFIQKTLAGNVIEKRLKIEVKPVEQMPPVQKYHLMLLPSTCLVHTKLLLFVSGFMNYKARKLLDESLNGGRFKKPSGDVVISHFPQIYDNPDIIEELGQIWVEDVLPKIISSKFEYDIQYLMKRMKDFVCRVYQVLYSEPFKVNLTKGTTFSGCYNKKVLLDRQRLIQSALRFGQTYEVKVKDKKNIQAPSTMTSFTPFSVRELEYDVWDIQKTKEDKFLNFLDEKKKGKMRAGM